MKDWIQRAYNKIRIAFLERFTRRVIRISLEDKEGNSHEVVVEREVEKVCDHKEIKEIAPTMWKCTKCNDAYFQIGYKILLTEADLISFLAQLEKSLKIEFEGGVTQPEEHA